MGPDRTLPRCAPVPRTLDSVPEGDTIHYAANRIRRVLEGHVPDELATPHPRFGRARWPERLAGRAVRSVDAHGKHLFLRFEGGLTIHSHLRMTGSWRVIDADREPSRAAWLVIRRDGRQVVQVKGPVLELMTDSRTRLDQRIAGLGPDILAPRFDYERFVRRLREDDPTRPIGDAVLEQRTVAGIGNLWKAEGCWDALLALRHAHPGARPVGRQPRHVLVSRMPALRRVGHKGADLIAPGNTRASFDAALEAGVDMIEFDVLPERWPAEHETRLVLAHDYEHAPADAMTLDEGLAYLAGEAFGAVELDVDLKLPGYEARVVDALRAHGLVERTLVSSQYMRSLVQVRALEPGLRLGWSVPRAHRDYTKSLVWVLPALSALAFMRRRLPGLAAGHIGAGRVDAVMAHQRLGAPGLRAAGP